MGGLEDNGGARIYHEGAPYEFTTATELNVWREMTIDEIASNLDATDPKLAPCVDDYYATEPAYSHGRQAYWATLQDMLQNDSIETCNDLEQFCYDGTAPKAVRFFCSETCGGNSLYSGQAMGRPPMGMPGACIVPHYNQLLQQPCEERNAAALFLDSGWQRYVVSLSSAFFPYFLWNKAYNKTEAKMLAGRFRQNILDMGCAYFAGGPKDHFGRADVPIDF